jgi:shikimate kinase
MSAAPSSPSSSPSGLDYTGIAARIDRPVVLVGLMGAGKSTVGKRLASMLGRGFIDADDAIAEAARRTIPEIFASFGEAHFRDGERRVIARLIEEGHGVIATGGGAFVDPATRALVLDKGIAVWIDCDIDTLVERTARRANRPLLKQGNPREILTRLAAERAPFYAEAPIRVVSENGPHADTARAIIEAIGEWL